MEKRRQGVIMSSLIDCYIFDINELKGEGVYQYAVELLPRTGLWKERTKRIFAFLKAEDKMRGIGAGLLLKYIFDNNHIKYDDLRINQYGKPYIENSQAIRFNISHSGDFVVCTFGNDESGVDIEKEVNCIDVAKRFFTKEEYQRIAHGDIDMFTRIWTLKEAYIKELGVGFSIPLNSFEVHLGRICESIDCSRLTALPLLEKTVIVNDLERQFREFRFKDYYVSICSKAMITHEIKEIGVSQLIYES